MTRRPYVTGTGQLDSVERWRLFEQAHPEVTFVPPAQLWGRWRAIVPAGSVPGDLGSTTIGDFSLTGLLDRLDVIFPPDGGG